MTMLMQSFQNIAARLGTDTYHLLVYFVLAWVLVVLLQFVADGRRNGKHLS